MPRQCPRAPSLLSPLTLCLRVNLLPQSSPWPRLHSCPFIRQLLYLQSQSLSRQPAPPSINNSHLCIYHHHLSCIPLKHLRYPLIPFPLPTRILAKPPSSMNPSEKPGKADTNRTNRINLLNNTLDVIDLNWNLRLK